MPKTYHAKRIYQLLQIASWKSKSELSFSGFLQLSNRINDLLERTELRHDYPQIKQKYLNELFLCTKEALAQGGEVRRSVDYINAILFYVGFSSWDQFEKCTVKTEGFINLPKANVKNYNDKRIGVLTNQAHKDEIENNLEFTQKKMSYSIQCEVLDIEDAIDLHCQLKLKLTEYPLLVITIPEVWEQLMVTSDLQADFREILNSGKVIPVPFGNSLYDPLLPSQILEDKGIASGEIGLLLALSTIENRCTYSALTKDKSSPPCSASIQIGTLNNSGAIFTGNIYQENFGGNNSAASLARAL